MNDEITPDRVAAKLAAWRDAAAAAGRADDAQVLAAALKIVGDAVVRAMPAAERAASGPGGQFVPRGERIDAIKTECCPWTKDGGCPVCQIDREHPFAIPNLPGRAFACLTYLGA